METLRMSSHRLKNNITDATSLLVTLVWMLALFTGQDWWLAALLIGYIAIVPFVALLFSDEPDRETWWNTCSGWCTGMLSNAPTETVPTEIEESEETPLDTLQRRYARGELTDEQFERKLDQLLEMETLEDVADRARIREREM
ncbi:SHOCT domain-containing protein [Haladaptatus halobius]|uniref:SHOCT domain-containing protein n=1 Tax=Haladaptatus halobius TaxID=2884875 RepID=UPI001D0A75FC|nr:SHOCT domain-containing protein [Haladaptatus halobius]